MSAPASLSAFLRLPRPHPPAHVVLGNEAADLDSIACALAYAYLSPPPRPQPVVNIARGELRLRRDALHALSLARVAPADLAFADALALAPAPAALTLVDHNALAAHQAALAPLVRAVVDHHADERLFPDAAPRTVAPVGSCASLVAEVGRPDRDTARLLLCAILIDTANMHPAGKGTPRDARALHTLSEIAQWGPEMRQRVYRDLKAARNDITGFSLPDLLRKDMKVVEAASLRLAVCTVTISAHDLASRGERMADVVENFRADLSVDCVVVMNSYSSQDGHQRDMCVLANKVGDALAEELAREEVLRLVHLHVDLAEPFICFRQGNAKASRKVVAPVLKRVLVQVQQIQR